MTDVKNLRNIGKVTAAWLKDVGIFTEQDLIEMGVIKAYLRVKSAYPERVSLNLLYSLEGALLGIPWNQLPESMRADLLSRLAAASSDD
ncbi:MAG: TfoX/Sxy family protein [Chloroflexi bacterium]|nr:TfoX/Sxy family protein [Chloroflexota bacterium]